MNTRPLLSLFVTVALAACNGSDSSRTPTATNSTAPAEPAPQPASLPPGHPPLDSGKASLPAGHPPIDMNSQTLPSGSTAGAVVPQWTVPEGWKTGPPNSMRVATFLVTGAENQSAEIAISAFPGDVGGPLANINRWRGQLGQGPIKADEVAGLTTPIEVNGVKGTLVDLDAGAKRMLVVTLPHEGNSWFFKMTGDAAVVQAQKQILMEFVKSVKF